jgi:transposase
VNGRWADAKIFLHFCFGWRPAVQACVQVNKRQILALLGREGFCRATHARHPIQLFVRASNEEEAQMNVRYRVELSQAERTELTTLLSGGKHAARKLKRAQILLAADAGTSDDDIATSVGVGGSTIYRTKQRFVLGNLQAALSEMPRPGASRKLSGKEEALLVATACSKPPQGRVRWTLELLAGKLVSLTQHDSVSRETVRRRLVENDLKPWRKDMWCIPQVDGEYVARMENVLDLYAEDPDPKCPLVCFDESPIQLIGEVRQPIPAAPGQLERYDCEYKRNGTANLFIVLDVHRPWRKVKVTERRAAEDYAQCMRELVDVDYPNAERIRWCKTTYRSTQPAPSTRHSRPPKPGAFCDGWSSTTLQSTQVGSTWSRSRLGCYAANALTDASTPRSSSNPRSLPGNVSAMPQPRASNGCSQPIKPAPKWAALTHTPLPSAWPKPKSHNHCAEVLVWRI